MLSNETKLNRINERLSLIGAKLEFACYDLKTYTPRLVNINNSNSRYFVVEGYKLIFRTFVENNKVVFGLAYIPEMCFSNYEEFNHFFTLVKVIKDVLDSCNRYGIEVPKYK